jgi:excisionase family DNA binding protein
MALDSIRDGERRSRRRRNRSRQTRLAYRPAELAELVGLSTKAIYRAIDRGELEAARVANGSRLLIPSAAADRWLAADTDEPGVPRPAARVRRGRPLTTALATMEDAPRNGKGAH